MKAEMRQQLARLPFENKIRKVNELIQLSRKIKNQPRTLSGLKGSKAIDVFVSEREREREL